MRLFGISVAHCRVEITAYSLIRYAVTASYHHGEEFVLVDNCYPINPEQTSNILEHVAHMAGATYMKTNKNLGGAGGFNHALSYLNEKYKLQPDDLIIGYDSDSNPRTQGWLKALVNVMETDLNLNSLSLMHDHLLERPWILREVAGHRVASLPHVEMANVTIWRAGPLLAKGGIKSGRKFYGFNEVCMFEKEKSGYLYDFRETLCEIQHDDLYNKWKSLHAMNQFPDNFDVYLRFLEGQGSLV